MVVMMDVVAAKKKLMQLRNMMRTIPAPSGFTIHLEKPNASNALVGTIAVRKKLKADFGAYSSFGSSF